MKFEERVIEIIYRSADVKSFRFPRPSEFRYKPGQYITVQLEINGKRTRKPFTLSSSPTDKGYIEFTKKLTGHEFSNALEQMNVGDKAFIEGPYGKMVFENEYKKIGLLSGGIGITPMISICKYCTDKSLETNIILISSYKNETDCIFRRELREMETINPNLIFIETLTRPDEEWKGYRGRICESMISDEMPDYKERVFYICGPPPMVKSIADLLKNMDVPSNQIKKEAFTGY